MKMGRSLRVLVLAASFAASVLSAVVPASASTYTRYPTDDVSVRSDYPDTGGNATGSFLYVGGTFVGTNDFWATYLKFDLSQFAEGTINSATLYMVCYTYSGTGVNVNAYEVTSDPYDWSEDWMSWNHVDSTMTVSGSAAATTKVNKTNTAFTWDLTYEAQQHMGGDFSVRMKEQNQPSDGKWAEFYSNDYSSGGYWPYLAVDYTDPNDEENDRLYGWEDLGTILGFSGSCNPPVLASNVIMPELAHGGIGVLQLESLCLSGQTQAYLAYIFGLQDGDVVYCGFWRHDTTPGATPSCQIWAHWNDSFPPDVNGYNGSAGGNPDFGPGAGWDMTDWSWTVSGGHTGLVIECNIESYAGGTVWVDDMHIRVPLHATVLVPGSGSTSTVPATWGRVKAMFK